MNATIETTNADQDQNDRKVCGCAAKVAAERMARKLAHSPSVIDREWDREDYRITVENSVSPVEFTVRHYAGSDVNETGRIQVRVPRDGVSNGTVIRVAKSQGFEVVDIWQLTDDLETSMGSQGHASIRFGLEASEVSE